MDVLRAALRMTRLAICVLGLATLITTGLWRWYASTASTWHEEIAAYPADAHEILVPAQRDRDEPAWDLGCAAPDAPLFATSSGRPRLSLCIGGRSYPLMVTAYFTGYLYWPSSLFALWHHDDVLRLRVLSLLTALASLLLTALLVRQLAGLRVSLAGAVLTATCSPFIISHSVLMHYETLPWACVCAALLGLARCPWLLPAASGSVPGSRAGLFAAAGFSGLAVAVNIKAVFLLVPLAVYSRWIGIRWHRVRRRDWAIASAVALVPVLPMVLFALLDPGRGFSGQVSQRMDLMISLTLERIVREPLNVATFWSDLGFYAASISGDQAERNWLGIALALLALVHCVVAFATVRSKASSADGARLVAGGAGALFLGYMVLSIVLYSTQRANYAALHTVFAFAMATMLVRLGDRLRRTAGRLDRAVVPLLVGIVAVALGFNIVRRGSPGETTSLPINTVAQLDMVRYLIEHRGRGEPVYTTTYNLAGMPDSLSGGALRTKQAHRYLLGCTWRDPAQQEACMTRRWRALLEEQPERPVWVVAPAKFTRIEEPDAARLRPTLEAAAVEIGASVVRAATFAAGRGVDVLHVYRVD
jgi:hypothetical protein